MCGVFWIDNLVGWVFWVGNVCLWGNVFLWWVVGVLDDCDLFALLFVCLVVGCLVCWFAFRLLFCFVKGIGVIWLMFVLFERVVRLCFEWFCCYWVVNLLNSLEFVGFSFLAGVRVRYWLWLDLYVLMFI